jgi:predicted regulator of Ras-like GTPase activity (Roadblock/LC7/MglB family)
MNGLVQDLNAETVILTCAGGLIAHAGPLSEQDANSLARVVADNWRTSARVAEILGQRQQGFELSVDGGQHMLFSLGIVDDIVLSAAMNTDVHLGMVRHSTKTTAESVRRLLG